MFLGFDTLNVSKFLINFVFFLFFSPQRNKKRLFFHRYLFLAGNNFIRFDWNFIRFDRFSLGLRDKGARPISDKSLLNWFLGLLLFLNWNVSACNVIHFNRDRIFFTCYLPHRCKFLCMALKNKWFDCMLMLLSGRFWCHFQHIFCGYAFPKFVYQLLGKLMRDFQTSARYKVIHNFNYIVSKIIHPCFKNFKRGTISMLVSYCISNLVA